MSDITLVLLAAGNSTRMGLNTKKQWLYIGEIPLWQYVANDLSKKFDFVKTIVVGNADELEFMAKFDDKFEFVVGGDERQFSLLNALKSVDSEYVMVNDVARAQIPQRLIDDLIANCVNFDCVSPVLGVNDTAYLGENLIDRNAIKLIQTPQISRTKMLLKALQTDEIFTDDSSAVASVGGKLGFVKGDKNAFKITHLRDLKELKLKAPSQIWRSGNGFDVHKFQNGDGLVLCGIKVPCEYGFVAHSDGDVAIHALIDAILGACGLGDIGELYPDIDQTYAGINSEILLKDSLKKVRSLGFELANADITIIAQYPKISPYKNEMAKNLAKIMNISQSRINVKATTTEKLGFTGRKEGIATLVSVNMKLFDWTQI